MSVRRSCSIVAVCLAAWLASLPAPPPAGAYVYWANVNVNEAIGRANLDGSGANQSFIPDTPSHGPCGVALDSQHIYWANVAFFGPEFMLDTTIGRAKLDGSGADQSFITGAHGPCGVAADANHVYWANEGDPSGIYYTPGTTIGRANLDGSGVEQSFITGASSPCGVAVDANHVYWANIIAGTIGRANLDGSGVDQSFISGANHPCGVAVDSGHIYWANSGWGGSSATGTTIGRANLDGSGVDQSFIAGAHGPSGVAVDSGHIYWANSNFPPSSIGRANLDGSGVDQSFIAADANPDGVAVDALQPRPPAQPVPLASNRFQIRKLRPIRRRGIVLVVVHIFSPGKLVLFGRKLRRANGVTNSTGIIRLKARPKRRVRRALRRRHKVLAWAKIRFMPTGGVQRTKRKELALYLSRRPVQVICASLASVRPLRGRYVSRPRSCVFHKRGAPVDYADTVAAKRLRWLRWSRRSAIAEGRAAENIVGLVPVKVKLARPVRVCGHSVFSQARFKFPRAGDGYGRPMRLDRRLPGSCP